MRGNNIWDDPEWERLRKRASSSRPQQAPGQSQSQRTVNPSANVSEPAVGPQNSSESTKKLNLSLNLTVPKIKLSKKQKKATLGLVGIAVIGIAGLSVYNVIDKPKNNDATDVLAENVSEPEFDTVLPDGKKEETDGNKIGYDAQKKVASFRDTIGNVAITVSQQPLPEQFKTNPDEEVKKMAEGFSAYNVINESNPKAYLGNDVSGAQTVIFHKNNVLVFILSAKQIEKDQWAEYITKLL